MTLRILTGIEEAYVELGATEPIAQDPAGILEQLGRNDRANVTGSGEMQFGGETVGYLDMESVVDRSSRRAGRSFCRYRGSPYGSPITS